MLPDVACMACSICSHSQTAGDAFMFGRKNRFKVRRLPLAPSHILPLGYSQAGVVCTTLGFINETDHVSSCSAPRSWGARVRMRQQQEYSCTPMHAVSEEVAVWESWPGLTKALCLICSTLKPGHLKASRRSQLWARLSLSHSEVIQHSGVHSRGRDLGDRSTRASQSRKPLLWQSEEHSEADAALRARTKGFSPPLKASHCSFGALKCWYCFPRDFGHAFNMKSPRGGDKKRWKK